MLDDLQSPVHQKGERQRPHRQSRRPSVVELKRLCDGCGTCVMACPHALLLINEKSLPELVSQELCARCGLCVDACNSRTGALN
ncbi:4Fe-4S dicluster domain-containing protein [Roseovarius sp. 2305UL8-3]|uniref:4Fe-4S dicluster domain-containing protein n=1 Tax=Roseovarius conchicola TaxID=3121636 RepID=UPI0035272AEA